MNDNDDFSQIEFASFGAPIQNRPVLKWSGYVKAPKEMNLAANNSLKDISNNIAGCSHSFQKLSISSNQSGNVSASIITPTRKENKRGKKTPSKNKSPGRSTTPTPNKAAKTPNKADRFIPSRNNSNYDLCHFMLNKENDKVDDAVPQNANAEIIGRALCDTEPGRLLKYDCKVPAAPDSYNNRLKTIYTQAKLPSTVKNMSRYIPQTPDRILDAPEILDNYYLNLVDWSSLNIVAVALNHSVYLWNAGTGQIEQLLTLNPPETVCSVSWVQDSGSHLAVGTSSAKVELWDCAKMKRLRIMNGHTGRVGALAWNLYVVSSGSRDGHIVHHDVRQRDHIVASIAAHSQEICGLKWSPDGKYLASGGNDNILNIWPIAQGQHYSQTQYLCSFNQHLAAVKGLAWCPWSAGILASGGGTADRTIRIWNVNTGANINTVDTNSQVCSILWSTHYKELVSGHGFANNQMIIWKYPTMAKLCELSGHEARILHLALSPDGQTVLSASADETLRLWKCFMLDPSKKKAPLDSKGPKSVLNMQSLLR